MNRKIERVRADIRKTEARLREYDEYLKTLKAKERQLEDEEIVSRIRRLQEKGADILDVLDDIHSGKGIREIGRELDNIAEDTAEEEETDVEDEDEE